MRRLANSAAIALALMLTLAVPSAFANGTAQNAKLRLTLAELPTTVVQGQAMRGTIALNNLTADYKNVSVSVALVTPLGNLPVRTTSVNLAPNASKVKRSSFTLTQDAKAGTYRLVITATTDDQTLTVFHDFTVVAG